MSSLGPSSVYCLHCKERFFFQKFIIWASFEKLLTREEHDNVANLTSLNYKTLMFIKHKTQIKKSGKVIFSFPKSQ